MGFRPSSTIWIYYFRICAIVLLKQQVDGASSADCEVDVGSGNTETQYCQYGCCGSMMNLDRRCCSDDSGLKGTTIAAIVIAAVIFLVVLFLLLYCCYKKKKYKRTGRPILTRVSRVSVRTSSSRPARSNQRRDSIRLSTIAHPAVPPPPYIAAPLYPPGPGTMEPPRYSSLGYVNRRPVTPSAPPYPSTPAPPAGPLEPSAPPYSPPPYEQDTRGGLSVPGFVQ